MCNDNNSNNNNRTSIALTTSGIRAQKRNTTESLIISESRSWDFFLENGENWQKLISHSTGRSTGDYFRTSTRSYGEQVSMSYDEQVGMGGLTFLERQVMSSTDLYWFRCRRKYP